MVIPRARAKATTTEEVIASMEDAARGETSTISTLRYPDPKAIFEECYKDVFYYFYRRVLSREEARDLTQETFLEVLKSIRNYRGDAPTVGWVMGIAHNVYCGVLRSRSRQKRTAPEISLETWLEEGQAKALGNGPSQPIERSLAMERGRLLREALSSLSHEHKNCIFLRLGRDLSYREIAEVLQISVEAVKSRLFQAKQHLRKLIGQHYESETLGPW